MVEVIEGRNPIALEKIDNTPIKITMGGNPVTLVGTPVKVGDTAKDFVVTDKDLSEINLLDFKDKIVVLSIFPSIDTPVCAAQTRMFNQKAINLGDDVVVLSISKDLPFALARFCAADGIDRVYTLSDYKANDFGLKYGFLIKEFQLLARGVVIIDKAGKVVYVEYVDEVTHEPNYESAFEILKGLM